MPRSRPNRLVFSNTQTRAIQLLHKSGALSTDALESQILHRKVKFGESRITTRLPIKPKETIKALAKKGMIYIGGSGDIILTKRGAEVAARYANK